MTFVRDTDSLLALLDDLVDPAPGAGWDAFFTDRSAPRPFFVDKPDENLAGWAADGELRPGRALELGCGNGRNARFLAAHGFVVDAVDLSAEALRWARERPVEGVRYHHCSIFDAPLHEEGYDLVYDSGCLHHLPPHRRAGYVDLLGRALRPGGTFGLVCFRPEGGSGLTDEQVYERRTLGGGLGYDEDGLRALFDRPPFTLDGLRPMRTCGEDDDRFGLDLLWVARATRA